MEDKYKLSSMNNLINRRDKIIEDNISTNSIMSPIDLKSFQLLSGKLLSNKTFGIKDNIAYKGIPSTGGSKLLEQFIPNFTSSVVTDLISNGAIPFFKTNLDELGMGSTGLSSSFGDVKNPIDNQFLIGGSSSGSAYVVAKKLVDFSIGSDTGDSIRIPAAWTGIVGYKPTWDLISRNGLFDFAPTWDTIGFFTNEVQLQIDIINSIIPNHINIVKDIIISKLKIGYIKSVVDEALPEIRDIFYELMKDLKNKGFEVIELNDVKIDNLKLIIPTYKIQTSLESFSSNSNLRGDLFGKVFSNSGSYNDRITASRDYFGYEVKKRILFASWTLKNSRDIYSKILKSRSIIIKELDNAFKIVDIIISPSYPKFAPKTIEEDNRELLSENFLTLFNANGSPSISLPYRKGRLPYSSTRMPIGINVAAKPNNDNVLLNFSKYIEGEIND